VKQLIARLRAMGPNAAEFDELMQELKESVERHVDEEEGELFRRRRAALGAELPSRRRGALQMRQLVETGGASCSPRCRKLSVAARGSRPYTPAPVRILRNALPVLICGVLFACSNSPAPKILVTDARAACGGREHAAHDRPDAVRRGRHRSVSIDGKRDVQADAASLSVTLTPRTGSSEKLASVHGVARRRRGHARSRFA